MIVESMLVYGVVTLASYVATKCVYRKIDKNATFNKIMNEGLYHFTLEENCKKILESGYVKEFSKFASYGNEKSFFFAGVPSFEDMVINCDFASISGKLTAVKIKPTFEQLASFKTRTLNDNAITYDGNCKIDDKHASIAYFVTDLDKNGKVFYTEVDRKTYDEYVPSKAFQDLAKACENNKLKFIMKALKTDMKYSYETVTTIINENLHKIKLVKDNVYSDKRLKKPFNFKESIKADIQYGIEKLKALGFRNRLQNNDYLEKSSGKVL